MAMRRVCRMAILGWLGSSADLLCNDQFRAGIRAHSVESARNARTNRILVAAAGLGDDGSVLGASANDGAPGIKRGGIADVDDKPGVFGTAHPVHCGTWPDAEELISLGARDLRGSGSRVG